VGVRFLLPVQTRPGANIASSAMGTTVSFLEVKWPGLGVDDTPPSCAGVTERVK